MSSGVLLNVQTWINTCYFSSFFDTCVNYIVCFLNENMVKPVQNYGVFV